MSCDLFNRQIKAESRDYRRYYLWSWKDGSDKRRNTQREGRYSFNQGDNWSQGAIPKGIFLAAEKRTWNRDAIFDTENTHKL